MDTAKEIKIFDKATEKLDLYVPFLLQYGHVDDAKEFLKPGGQYVRFAVKQFMKEILGELIRPVGEWKEDPTFLDMEPVYETIKKELPEHFQVRRELIGYIFSEFVNVTISEILTLRVKRGTTYHYSVLGIAVKGYPEDEDKDWMELVAQELNDEELALEADGELGDDAVWFFPDQTEEFCRLAESIYANFDRYAAMAEDKAQVQREKYHL